MSEAKGLELEQVKAAAKEAWGIAWGLVHGDEPNDALIARLDKISTVIGIPKGVITELHGKPYTR